MKLVKKMVKIKLAQELAMKAKQGSRGITVPFL
jgi:hypothetical protein